MKKQDERVERYLLALSPANHHKTKSRRADLLSESFPPSQASSPSSSINRLPSMCISSWLIEGSMETLNWVAFTR
jgi:hypothetical protein